MKTKLTLLILLISITANSQESDFDFFMSFGLDPKMAIQGPGHDYGNTPSLDYEITAGFEINNGYRFSIAYKSHKTIEFQKWSYCQIEKRIKISNNFNAFTGLELSAITRKHNDFSPEQPNNYREYVTNPFQFGLSGEIQFRPSKSRFGLSIQSDIYQAEDELKEYKNYRIDITVKGTFYF